ncbi:hypothetical protein TSA1_26655 [Bradyrhizobium nitroreducens]|uniref:Conjugal transfer protein TrbJ n=1 Tax=Bradyrhizobium nitroreducens TaxID=709803 RepID=A0A2M6UHC5_9BRAD|nr:MULTISPECIES: hypothetical protein [Bradyrhizobium]MBJ7402189.1 hypothetical protein [Bradyrhizobium sp.]MBR0926324.1 hypothetical protein [Bradyrhizobium diazoefficiens]PIT03951.1 hypothetical protein TSA1_26655 [Bradyrhizobium nitroreducens]
MLIKTLAILTTTSALTAAGYAGLTVVSPTTASTIESFVRDRALGWSESACLGNAEGCLNNRYEKLSQLERSIGQSIEAVRVEFNSVTSLVSDQELLAGKNTAFLEQGRAAYRDKAGFPDQSIIFAGKTYPSLDIFRSQLELLFQEKTALEQSLASARELRRKLKERLEALMIQAGQISLAKRMVPGQLQLVRANQVLSDFGANVAMIDGIIRGSEAGINQSEQLIRTTRDLAAPSKSTANPSRATAEAFQNFLHN